jgi:hypothetical protein
MHSPNMKQRLEADGSQPAERMTLDELKATIARASGVRTDDEADQPQASVARAVQCAAAA